MNKQDLVRDMKKEIGSFPNTSQIARYLHQSRDSVRTLISDLECIKDGRSKKYFVVDVAERLLQQRTV